MAINMSTVCKTIADDCWAEYSNVSADRMEECYLSSSCFEPQSMHASFRYPLTMVYLLILLSGVIGNLSTCLVITTSKYSLLQTTTNRYLLNLALADLVSLISGIPFEIYLMWHQYPWRFPDLLCHMKAWVSETTSYVSVLTIVTFSVERYVAICHSFVMTKISSSIHKHLVPVLLMLWLVAGVCAAPYAVYHRADYVLREWPYAPADRLYGPVTKTKMCMLAIAFDGSLRPVFLVLFHASAVLFFLLPLTTLMGLYGKVGCAVKLSRRAFRNYGPQQPHATNPERKSSTNTNVSVATNCTAVTTHSNGSSAVGVQDYDSKKVLCILIAVVAAFFICYAPYQAQRLLFFYITNTEIHQIINTYLYLISGVLFYLSSTLNPILYNLISTRYRRAFREVLCRCMNRHDRAYCEKHHQRYNSQMQAKASVCQYCVNTRNGASWMSSRFTGMKNVAINSCQADDLKKQGQMMINSQNAFLGQNQRMLSKSDLALYKHSRANSAVGGSAVSSSAQMKNSSGAVSAKKMSLNAEVKYHSVASLNKMLVMNERLVVTDSRV